MRESQPNLGLDAQAGVCGEEARFSRDKAGACERQVSQGGGSERVRWV